MRQNFKVSLHTLDIPRNKKYPGLCCPGHLLGEDSPYLHQTHHGLRHGVEQAHGQPILIAENAPALEPPNAMFHLDPSLRQPPVLFPLFRCQLPAFGFFVGRV